MTWNHNDSSVDLVTSSLPRCRRGVHGGSAEETLATRGAGLTPFFKSVAPARVAAVLSIGRWVRRRAVEWVLCRTQLLLKTCGVQT